MLVNLGSGLDSASIASVFAHGGSDYTKWARALGTATYAESVYATSLNFADVAMPPATAYYFGPNLKGCNVGEDGDMHPKCSTIFDGAYMVCLQAPESHSLVLFFGHS